MSSPSPAKKHPPAARPGAWALRTGRSDQALLRQFRRLLPAPRLARWLGGARFYHRAFTPLITLWYLAVARLGDSPCLSRMLADARAGGADALSPPGKRLSQQLRSCSTASLSDARQRLPLAAAHQALRHCGHQIRSWVQGGLWRGLHVVLLDGTTFRLRPHNDIPTQFPVHRSGNNAQPYWCLARVVAGFCLATGVALDCAIGSLQVSEQALALRLLASRWRDTLLLADRNFGIYSFVRAATAAQAHVLVRLTRCRALKLAKTGALGLREGLDQSLVWTPSRHDQCPENLAPTAVQARLLVWTVQRQGFRPLTLYLLTTLLDAQTYPPQALVELYGCRWQVELDLRHVKSQLGLDALECKSADLARKEWLGGLLGYNLVRAVMTAAAAKAHLPVANLSFSRARQALSHWLIRWAGQPWALPPWQRLLQEVAHYVHPRRPKPRPPEPRAIRYFKKDVPKLSGDRAAARKKLKIANAKS